MILLKLLYVLLNKLIFLSDNSGFFVFKLGKLNKSPKISKTEKENFASKIRSLEEKNKQLLARLERLEKIALGDLKSKDLVVYKPQ